MPALASARYTHLKGALELTQPTGVGSHSASCLRH